MLTKQLVNAAISDLPKIFTLDEIMQRMYILNKVERTREKSKLGKIFSTTETKMKLATNGLLLNHHP